MIGLVGSAAAVPAPLSVVRMSGTEQTVDIGFVTLGRSPCLLQMFNLLGAHHVADFTCFVHCRAWRYVRLLHGQGLQLALFQLPIRGLRP